MFPPVMGPVIIRRPSGRTTFNDPTGHTTREQEGCAWAPRFSDEETDLRETVIVGYWLFVPFGADIQATDEVLIPEIIHLTNDGEETVIWQVDGEPGRWQSPWTHIHIGTQIALKRANG